MENLDYLLKDLEPHEAKLTQVLKKARMQMRKEEEAYNEVPDTVSALEELLSWSKPN